MTSFGNNIQTQPYKSDLLQKHIERSMGANSGVQNQTKPDSLNSNIEPPKNDSFEIEKNKGKNGAKKAKIAAVSLGTTIALGGISILGGTKAGRKAFGKVSSTISNSISKYLKKLYENNRSEKLDNIIKKFYCAKDAIGSYGNSVENIVNGKDVLTTAIADVASGRAIKTNKMSAAKKRVVDLYKKTIGRFFGFYENFKNSTSGLYFRKGTAKSGQHYTKAGKARANFNEEVLKHLKEIKNSSRKNEFITYKGKSVRISEVITELEANIGASQRRFDEAFSPDIVYSRIGSFYDDLLGITGETSLSDKTTKAFVQKIKKRKFKDLLTTPVARGIIEDKKALNAQRVFEMKKSVSSNINAVFDSARNNLVILSKKIGSDDLDSLYEFEEVIKTFDRYKNQIFDGSADSKKSIETIMEKLDELSACLHSYSKKSGNKAAKEVYDSVSDLKHLISNVESNETDELMGVLRQILDPDTYEKAIIPKYKKSRKLLDKAFNMETNDMIDKIRDIACGSAPTDFMTVITSAGLLSLYTAQAENNDERVSIGLTTGLPILATVGMNLYGAINAISGKSSMALSLAVGAVTKFVCDKLNKGYRKLRGLDENQKSSIKTIDDYIEPHKNKFENIFNKNT